MIAQPLLAGETGVIGVLVVVTTRSPGPGLMGAVGEVARYASSQIELAELDASRARLDRAEVRALRAQICPHFIYNALKTHRLVRAYRPRAGPRTRSSSSPTSPGTPSGPPGEYTTLAEELRNIDRYLRLERARFGDSADRSSCRWPRGAATWWLPFLALQPLVENAVRTVSREPGRRYDGASWPATRAPIARSPSRTTVSAWTRSFCATGPPTRWRIRTPVTSRPRRAHQCRSSAARRLRRRLRARGRDGARARAPRSCMRVPKFRSGVQARGGAIGVSEAMMKRARRRRRGPALDELAYLLQRAPADRPGAHRRRRDRWRCASCTRRRRRRGLPGHHHARARTVWSWQRVLSRFAQPPAIVFVTAYDDNAVAAFDVGAVDYLLKPISRRTARRGRAPGRGASLRPNAATRRRGPTGRTAT